MKEKLMVSMKNKALAWLKCLLPRQIIFAGATVFIVALIAGFGILRAVSNVVEVADSAPQDSTAQVAELQNDESDKESTNEEKPSESEKPADETATETPEAPDAGGAADNSEAQNQNQNATPAASTPTAPQTPQAPAPTQPVQPAEPPQPPTPPTNTPQAEQILAMVNQARAAEGLVALTLNSTLNVAAGTRAIEISSVFSHTRPDGSNWSSVSSLARGENIAVGYMTAQDVFDGWMASPGHRENIMRPNFRTLGVGYYQTGTGYRWHWVQLFGN